MASLGQRESVAAALRVMGWLMLIAAGLCLLLALLDLDWLMLFLSAACVVVGLDAIRAKPTDRGLIRQRKQTEPAP